MSIGTILLVVLFLSLSFFSKAKKALEEVSAPQGHPVTSSQDEDGADSFEGNESPYFTYESDVEEIARTHKAPKAQRQTSMAPAHAAEPVDRLQFDLRQAVIGQVILQNRYIDEINQ
jgi:hypothetical protein